MDGSTTSFFSNAARSGRFGSFDLSTDALPWSSTHNRRPRLFPIHNCAMPNGARLRTSWLPVSVHRLSLTCLSGRAGLCFVPFERRPQLRFVQLVIFQNCRGVQ
jgi:hypothetical protein